MERIDLYNIYNKKVTLILTDTYEEANFITHSGTFHADEVMATVLLLNKFDEIKLYRTNEIIDENKFIYDIGFKEFDHHALTFDEKRENGIKYASCGLIWKKYASDILNGFSINNKKDFINKVDENLIMDIDRDDNGQKLTNDLNIKQETIPSIINSFNPVWNSSLSENKCFINAVFFANTIFNNIISHMIAKEEARNIIEKKIEESKESYIVLDKYMPWKDIVLSSKNKKAKDILYAIFPSKRGGYNVVATPKEINSFDVKKPFPKSWAGLDKEDLRKISGIKTINFCHKNLFICATEDFDDAIKIVNISLNE